MSLTWTEATRLATKGGAPDRLRRVVIAGCAALGAMLLSSLAALPSFWDRGSVSRAVSGAEPSVLGQLLADPGLAPGVVIALLVAAVPVLHLMAHGVRIGAPGRDRRLAAMRSAGATAADVRGVVRAEALVCAAAGAVVGVVAFHALLVASPHVFRVDYARWEPGGTVTGSMPVLDVGAGPNPFVSLAVSALVPLLAALVVPLTARRVGVSAPVGRSPGDGMSPMVAASFIGCSAAAVLGAVGFVVLGSTTPGGSTPVVSVVAMLLPLAAVGLLVTTLVVLAPGLASRAGRRLAVRDGAVCVIAGRLMTAHPRLASRTAASLVLVAVAGALAIVVGGLLEAEVVGQDRWTGSPSAAAKALDPDVLFYLVPIMVIQVLAVLAAALGAVGLLIAVSEQVTLRGPQLARQIAMGVPRSVIRRALVVEAAVPVVVMTTIALVVSAGVPVVATALGDDPGALASVHWGRLVLLWSALVGASVLAAHLGSRGLAAEGELQRVMER